MQEKKQTFMAQTQADKQLRRALISMIASIVLCMGCLIGTTWAWFETSITNEGNVITIAEMQVSVTMHKGETSEYKNLVATDQYTYELDEVGTYSIVLINTGDIPGYCTIRLKDVTGETEEFTSGTLYPTSEGWEDAATITIEITGQDTEILPVELKIEPHWGDDPNYAIVEVDEELFLPEEETAEAPTEETPDSEDPDLIGTTDPSEAPSEPTEGKETAPSEPEATTEPAGEPDSSQPEEPTEATTQPTESEPEETDPADQDQ